jgi:predicted ArsR family transcriptional regulator
MRTRHGILDTTKGRILAVLRRREASINALAKEVGISGNAVRQHLMALQADGLVREAGSSASTGGKPAQLYALTAEAEEIFPKAYALVLKAVVRQLIGRDGLPVTLELLRETARQAAPAGPPPGKGVEPALEVLRSLGGDVRAEETEEGWLIQGAGCPLSDVVMGTPEVCVLVEELVSRVTGRVVQHVCDRSGDRPNCAFRVLAA